MLCVLLASSWTFFSPHATLERVFQGHKLNFGRRHESIIGFESIGIVRFFLVDCRRPHGGAAGERISAASRAGRKGRYLGADAASTGGQDARHRESNAERLRD